MKSSDVRAQNVGVAVISYPFPPLVLRAGCEPDPYNEGNRNYTHVYVISWIILYFIWLTSEF